MTIRQQVFGLGNRQYEHFCEMGRRVSKHMKAMGATEIVPAGEGDDDGRCVCVCVCMYVCLYGCVCMMI